jgi:4-amino-4-deoxy-L-arabinose transferase-like glycosyltransferase
MDKDFEEMRQQMNILKEKLQKQEIVNEKVFRRSTRKSLKGINRRYTFVSILCILMVPYSYWAFVKLTGMSIWLWLATCVLMLIAFVYTQYTGRFISSRVFEKDLVQARAKVAKAKKLDHDWLKIGIPLIVLWLAYFGYEMYKVTGGEDSIYIVVMCVVCALLGGAVGLKIHFKNQDNYEQVIEEIDDFTKE